jgi:hypothetical protein
MSVPVSTMRCCQGVHSIESARSAPGGGDQHGATRADGAGLLGAQSPSGLDDAGRD